MFQKCGADPAIEERCGNDDRHKGAKQHGPRGVAEKASQGPRVRASRGDNRDTAKEKSPGSRERDRNDGATVKQRRAVPITDQHDRADNCRQRAQSAAHFATPGLVRAIRPRAIKTRSSAVIGAIRPVGTSPNISGIAHKPGIDAEVQVAQEFHQFCNRHDQNDGCQQARNPAPGGPLQMQNNSDPKERKTEGRARRHRDVASAHAGQELQTGNPANESQQREEDGERGAEQRHAAKTAARELSLRHAETLPEPGRLSKILNATDHRTRRGESTRKCGSPSVAPPIVKIGSPMTEDRHALPNRLEHFAARVPRRLALRDRPRPPLPPRRMDRLPPTNRKRARHHLCRRGSRE